MAGRIRRGTLVCGAAIAGVSNFEWNDQHEFDRSKGDDEWSGVPVEMDRKGGGSFKRLAGHVATGIQTSDMVLTFYEISMANGVETKVAHTATFKDVTINSGGSVPAEGKGERSFSFDYSTCTVV